MRATFSVALVELVSPILMVFLFLGSVLDCLLKGHSNLLALKITFKMTAVDGAGERSPLVYLRFTVGPTAQQSGWAQREHW